MAEVLQHKHLLIKGTLAEPPYYTTEITQWLVHLINDIGMNILSGPHVVYCDMVGNRGITGIVAIETSHIAIHVWDEPDPAELQLDVYTCSDLDIQTILEALDRFSPVSVEYKFLDRSANLTDISNGVVNYGDRNAAST